VSTQLRLNIYTSYGFLHFVRLEIFRSAAGLWGKQSGENSIIKRKETDEQKMLYTENIYILYASYSSVFLEPRIAENNRAEDIARISY
jgi:hypothetical protein